MFRLIYGQIQFKSLRVGLVSLLRILYFLATMPCYIFMLLLKLRTSISIGQDEFKDMKIVKRVLFHLSMLFWSLVGWGTIISIINDLL